ncbi:MAG: hypothetical protein IKF39_04240 [Oscillospiraceae bacterium]|nr:hypothetical protein [Oscillospiraceae bacterium]
MKRSVLIEKTDTVIAETRQALLTILDNLNQGQRKKVMNVPEVKALCERYGIEE